MIEALIAQRDILDKAAHAMGPKAEADIVDSVKRHLRILRQKPEVGRLALSIANLQAAIEDLQSEADRMSEPELTKTGEMLQRAVDSRPAEEAEVDAMIAREVTDDGRPLNPDFKPTPPAVAQPQESAP